MPAVALVLATPQEAERLLPMMGAFNAGEGIAVTPERLRPALDRLLRDESLGRVWLVRAGARLVGYVVLTFGYDLEFAGRDAFITEIFLEPQVRGAGLGRRALEAVEAQARGLGVAAIHLMVRPENTAAVRLYRAAGYEAPPRTFLSKQLDGTATKA